MLDVVIVNWNSGNRLRKVVTSIAAQCGSDVRKVIVVDNASTDGSIDVDDLLVGTVPFEYVVIRNESNVGFAAACNQGARQGDEEFLLFLNPDTEVFHRSFETPVRYLQAPGNSRVGIAGIQLIDEEGRVAKSCSRFPSLKQFAAQTTGISRLPRCRHLSQAMLEWGHNETRRVDQVMGAFFLVRRTLFETLDGFDERFFVYFEEVDFARRALEAGWTCVFVAEAKAFHEGGGTSRQVKPRRLFYSLRSRLLYGFKHFPPWQAWCLVALTFLVEPLSRTFFCLISGAGTADTWRGFRMLYADIPAILDRARRS